MRRFAHCDAAGHSSNTIDTVGYVALAQKFAHGTLLALHAVPAAPHSQVGAPL